MPRSTEHEPDDDDEWDSSDEYDAERDYDPEDRETYPEGLYDDDGPPTVPCRHCREEILEDSEQCPHCGMFQSDEDSPSEPKSRAWIVLMVLALIAVAMMTFIG